MPRDGSGDQHHRGGPGARDRVRDRPGGRGRGCGRCPGRRRGPAERDPAPGLHRVADPLDHPPPGRGHRHRRDHEPVPRRVDRPQRLPAHLVAADHHRRRARGGHRDRGGPPGRRAGDHPRAVRRDRRPRARPEHRLPDLGPHERARARCGRGLLARGARARGQPGRPRRRRGRTRPHVHPAGHRPAGPDHDGARGPGEGPGEPHRGGPAPQPQGLAAAARRERPPGPARRPERELGERAAHLRARPGRSRRGAVRRRRQPAAGHGADRRGAVAQRVAERRRDAHRGGVRPRRGRGHR